MNLDWRLAYRTLFFFFFAFSRLISRSMTEWGPLIQSNMERNCGPALYFSVEPGAKPAVIPKGGFAPLSRMFRYAADPYRPDADVRRFQMPAQIPPTPTLHICTPRENCYTNNNLTHTAHIHRLYLCKKVRARIEQAERFCDFTKLPTRRPGKRGKPACVPCVSGPAQFPRY